MLVPRTHRVFCVWGGGGKVRPAFAPALPHGRFLFTRMDGVSFSRVPLAPVFPTVVSGMASSPCALQLFSISASSSYGNWVAEGCAQRRNIGCFSIIFASSGSEEMSLTQGLGTPEENEEPRTFLRTAGYALRRLIGSILQVISSPQSGATSSLVCTRCSFLLLLSRVLFVRITPGIPAISYHPSSAIAGQRDHTDASIEKYIQQSGMNLR